MSRPPGGITVDVNGPARDRANTFDFQPTPCRRAGANPDGEEPSPGAKNSYSSAGARQNRISRRSIRGAKFRGICGGLNCSSPAIAEMVWQV
jgi:hypothetical protein